MSGDGPREGGRGHRLSLALYRLLLRAYPQRFRERYGADLEEDFRSLLSDQVVRGELRGRLAAWRVILRDLAVSAPRERIRVSAANRLESRPNGGTHMGSLGFDLRHALRGLRRAPIFSAVTIAILAVGIAANTATFSLVRHILLRPLPLQEPDELVLVFEALPRAGIDRFPFSAPDFVDLEEHQTFFSGVAAFSNREVELSGGDQPERLVAGRVTHDLFSLLGVEPALGRGFSAEEDRPGSDVAILDHGFWQRRFAGSPDILGRAIVVDRRPVTVVGVMPEAFSFPFARMPFHDQVAELFVPMAFTELELRARGSMHNHVVVARLGEGVSLERARSELERVAARIHANYPPVIRDSYELRLEASPLRDEIVGRAERPLLLLLGAMVLVLLVVCANVANLALSRATGRRSELALRAAMGADRARLFQVVLLETVLLAGAGGALAVLLARLVVGAVVARLGRALPMGSQVEVDASVVAFTVAATLAAAAIASIAPLVVGSGALEAVLREGSSKTTAGRGALRLQRGLVVATVTLAVVLLVGSGLLIRSFNRLTAIDAGFHEREILTMAVTLPNAAYGEPERVRGFVETLQQRLAALPAVERASLATSLPMSYGEIRAVVAENPVDPSQRRSVAVTWSVGPYLETLGIPLLAGRALGLEDRAGSTLVAMVSASFARQAWGDRSPLGQRIQWGVQANDRFPWMEVVGVVGDVHDGPLGSEPRPHVYVPQVQLADAELASGVTVGSDWGRSFRLALLAGGDPSRLTGAAIGALHELDGSLPVTDVETMAQVVARGVAPQRFSMTVVSAFGLISLLLAAIGLYGLLAFGVAQRSREIGLRVALGADRASLLRSVVGDGLLLVLSGVAVGLGAAAGLVRLLPAVLFETRVHDPFVFLSVPLALLVVAVAASLIPALRATRVDPMRALRAE
ncbi:MAG TPA: ABC transporter permease [Thermoanaerobaculia bacterium]|nr:ABC transporter permease [Thermoanaerobaculia bacterium]